MKNIIFTLTVTMLGQTVFSQSIDDNLLLDYSFSGNINDDSGNGFDGVGNAILTIDRFGNPSEAYYFNGSDSYIDLPNDPTLKPNLPVSLSFWVKFDDNDPSNSAVICTDFSQDNHAGVWISRSGAGNIAVNFGDNTGNTSSTNRRTKVGNTPLQANTWYHIAVVVNGPTDMEIYVDCVNDGGTYSGSGGALGYTSSPGSIGRKDSNVGASASYFKGTVDDLMYWDRALVTTDIDTLCNNILSIGEFAEELGNLVIYPNPSSKELLIEGINEKIATQFSIIDAQGKLIRETDIIDSNIDISNLETGIYYLKLETNSSMKVLKFVKE